MHEVGRVQEEGRYFLISFLFMEAGGISKYDIFVVECRVTKKDTMSLTQAEELYILKFKIW